jgi:hypothetical protein
MKRIIRSLIAALAIGVLAAFTLWPSMGIAQDARDAKAMAALKDQTAKLGAQSPRKERGVGFGRLLAKGLPNEQGVPRGGCNV